MSFDFSDFQPAARQPLPLVEPAPAVRLPRRSRTGMVVAAYLPVAMLLAAGTGLVAWHALRAGFHPAGPAALVVASNPLPN